MTISFILCYNLFYALGYLVFSCSFRGALNGKKEFISIKIAPEAVDPEDVEMLEDLILAAINEGLRKVSDLSKEEMDKITGGMNIPGIF